MWMVRSIPGTRITRLIVTVGALVLLSGGSAFASSPVDADDAVPGQLGPFCFHVAQASPVRPITNLKLVAQQFAPVPFFMILGQEFGVPAVSFLYGWGLQLGQEVNLALISNDFVAGKSLVRTFVGSLDTRTLRGEGRCTDTTAVAGGCGGGVAVTFETFPCP